MKSSGVPSLYLCFYSRALLSGFAQSHTTTAPSRVTCWTSAADLSPAATVEARNLILISRKPKKPTSDGHFAFLNLAPGRYQLTISQPGFASVLQKT